MCNRYDRCGERTFICECRDIREDRCSCSQVKLWFGGLCRCREVTRDRRPYEPGYDWFKSCGCRIDRNSKRSCGCQQERRETCSCRKSSCVSSSCSCGCRKRESVSRCPCRGRY